MNAWFRFYHEALDDPKVQSLRADLFKFWINILCLAAREDGKLPQISDISFGLRLSIAKTSRYIAELEKCGLIDNEDNMLSPHNWDGRQFKSDGSTDRVKRFRERFRNASEMTDATGPDSEQIQTHIQNRAEGEAPAEKRGGRLDPAAEMFRSAYRNHRKNPYEWQGGDFAQFAKLRHRLGIASSETPLDWEIGLENYFGSPFAKYSLKHFVTDYDTFIASALDRYKTPVNHKGNGNGHKESHSERVLRKSRETHDRISQRLSTADGDASESGDVGRTGLTLLPRPK